MEASIGGFASDNEHQNPSIGKKTSLLFINACVNDRRMKLMIDTGATRTFVSQECFNDMKERRVVNQVRRRVFLADGVTYLVVYGEVDLFIRIGTTKTFIRAFVVDRLCSGCILGMDFIRKYHLILDMMKQVVWIGGRSEPLHSSPGTGQIDHRSTVSVISHTRTMPQRMVETSIPQTSQQRYKDSIPAIPHSSPPSCSASDLQTAIQSIDHLITHVNSEEDKRRLREILMRHVRLFDIKRPTIATTLKPHEIKTLDHPPPAQKAYFSTPIKQEAMDKIIRELTDASLIRPSFSPYAAPALLVAKKDASWRMVVDYKRLNSITIKDNYPLPNMERTIQLLGRGYRYFSKLDMKSGFWQIPIKEENKHKTAFVTPNGLFEWNVLAQGLKNSPPSYQRVMAEVLSECRQFALVYIDDIVIFSRTREEHFEHLNKILSLLLSRNFQLNPPKCEIFHEEIDYLSHSVSRIGVKPTDDKIRVIRDLPEPTTLAQANKFIGGLSWYRKFLPMFATIAAPILAITNLTKPNRKKFQWNDPQHDAFVQLKQLMISQPQFLDFPDDDHPVILTTDASKVGIGGTLQQVINGETKNLYYHSQVTSPTQRRYSPIELEALAIWMCFQRMRSYLLGRSIIIYTDHCPLCNMMTSSVKNRRVDRISVLLQEYNIEKIIHIKGQHNCLADYLSRHPIHRDDDEIFTEDYGISVLFSEEPPTAVFVSDQETLTLNAVVTRSKTRQNRQRERERDVQPNSSVESDDPSKDNPVDSSAPSSIQSCVSDAFDIRQIKIEQSKDPVIQGLIEKIRQQTSVDSFVLHEVILCKLRTQSSPDNEGRRLIYIPTSMIDSLLKAYHSHPLSGHFGILRTYLKLKENFWWPGMRDSVTRYVKACLPCQQFNVSRIKKPGHLCPIEPPEGPFQIIGIDYCGPFKRTPRENQYVLCITDYFTRWIIALALPDCSAKTTAEAIFNEYICRYGVPVTVLSDKGTHFNNQLMDAMAKLVGFNHVFSTVYNPQSNGLVERFNATFVPQLTKLHDRENNNWDEYLSPVVFAYNTGSHATIEYSSFQLQFGREARLPSDQPAVQYVFHRPVDYYSQLQKSLSIIHQHARARIVSSQTRYKQRYDHHRSDPQYEINDQVLTRVHGTRSKLDPRYSLILKSVVSKQHPIYWIRDDVTQAVTRVHANDIRPIIIPPTQRQA